MSKIENKEQYEKIVNEVAKLYEQEKYEESIIKFQELAQYNFENVKVHELLCYNYLKLNQVKEAEKEFEILVGLSKKKNINFKLKTFDQMIEHIGSEKEIEHEYNKLMKKELNEISPKETGVVINMGLVHMAKGEYGKAKKVFQDHYEQLISLREKK